MQFSSSRNSRLYTETAYQNCEFRLRAPRTLCTGFHLHDFLRRLSTRNTIQFRIRNQFRIRIRLQVLFLFHSCVSFLFIQSRVQILHKFYCIFHIFCQFNKTPTNLIIKSVLHKLKTKLFNSTTVFSQSRCGAVLLLCTLSC